MSADLHTPWHLVSAEDRAHRYPKSFFIPSRKFRESLSVGNVAKLIFANNGDEAGERMWVEVTEVRGDGKSIRYRGTLANDPSGISGLRYGEIIEFGPEHVSGWEPAR